MSEHREGYHREGGLRHSDHRESDRRDRDHRDGCGGRRRTSLLSVPSAIFLFALAASGAPLFSQDVPPSDWPSGPASGAGDTANADTESTSGRDAYAAVVTDRSNREYRLTEMKRYRYEHFNCRLRGRFFELDFGRVRSVTFVEEPDETLSGFALADVALVGGASERVYIGTAGEEVRGSMDSLGIEISLPMSDVSSIVFAETGGSE